MAKCQVIRDAQGLFFGVRWWCPACASTAGIPMAVTLAVNWREVAGEPESPSQANAAHWTFNGDLDNPVFGPDINQSWGGKFGVPRQTCHSYIGSNGAQPGQITFLSDSTHHLAGQTIALLDVQPTD